MSGIEICELEGLCRLEMCSHVKDRILVESDTFVYFRVQECSFCSEISAVNLIVGWKLFAFRRNSSISLLLVSHAEMRSLINLFQKIGLMLLCLSICLSSIILAMNMLATAIFMLMAVPWV